MHWPQTVKVGDLIAMSDLRRVCGYFDERDYDDDAPNDGYLCTHLDNKPDDDEWPGAKLCEWYKCPLAHAATVNEVRKLDAILAPQFDGEYRDALALECRDCTDAEWMVLDVEIRHVAGWDKLAHGLELRGGKWQHAERHTDNKAEGDCR